MLVGGFVALAAGLFPLDGLARFVSIGTLSAFVLVAAAVIVLRRTAPDMHRPFRCPWVPWLPLATIGSCFYLMAGLGLETWARLGGWMVVGFAIYFLYGIHHSRVQKAAAK
jgi:APA family basic amino acid/polyamine antiporter